MSLANTVVSTEIRGEIVATPAPLLAELAARGATFADWRPEARAA